MCRQITSIKHKTKPTTGIHCAESFCPFFFFAALRSLLLGILFVFHQKPARPLQPMLYVRQAFHPFFAAELTNAVTRQIEIFLGTL